MVLTVFDYCSHQMRHVEDTWIQISKMFTKKLTNVTNAFEIKKFTN